MAAASGEGTDYAANVEARNIEIFHMGPSGGAVHGTGHIRAVALDSSSDMILSAERLEVAWTSVEKEAIASPISPGRPLVSIEDEPETGQTTFHQANAWLKEIHEDAEIWVEAAFNWSLRTKDVVHLEPSKRSSWVIGDDNDGTLSSDGGAPASHRLKVESGFPLMKIQPGSSAEARGTIELWLWGSTFDVEGANGSRAEYRSGNWSSRDSSPGHQSGVAYKETSRLVHLRATNASLSFIVGDADVVVLGDDVSYHGHGRFSADPVVGVLSGSSNNHQLQGEPLKLEGDLRVRTSKAVKSHDHLQIHLTARDAVGASLDDIPPLSSSSSAWVPYLSNWAPPVIGMAVLLVLIVSGGRIFRFALLPASAHYALAERALLERRPRAARRHAWWLHRKSVPSEDAWFLQAAGLAQAGKYRTMARTLPKIIDSLPDRAKPTFAFMIGLALDRLGREDDARVWVRRASKDEVIRRRIAQDVLLSRLLPRKGADHSSDGAAYA